ncbi:hypothetical protein K1719_027134 [Acacia pycnantha]|nr:hypothetical protein K1719_027134 [Acacia pycnantha]
MQVREFQNPPLLDYLKRGKIVSFSNVLLCVEINKHDVPPHSLLMIVSFDLAMEMFTVITIPDQHCISRLSSVYEETLAMVSCFKNSEHSVIDLWVHLGSDGVGLRNMLPAIIHAGSGLIDGIECKVDNDLAKSYSIPVLPCNL